MSMKVLTLLLLYFVGYSAANIDCNGNPALRCLEESYQMNFPENEEEVINLCKSFKTETECFLNFSEACEENQKETEQMRNMVSYLTQHCNGNSSIYQGAIHSLGCMRPIFNPEYEECRKSDDEKAMKFFNYLMELSERGITEATESDGNMMICLDILYLDACLAADVGKKCGPAARNSTVDIFQNLDINLKICKKEIVNDMKTLVTKFES